MAYRIKDLQRKNAQRLGVVIRPSSDPKKKLDVYKNGFMVARIGDIKYYDYAKYLQEERKGYLAPGTAEKRREFYAIRHSSDRIIKGTPGYYAYEILWK
jgi:hypothetical protein